MTAPPPLARTPLSAPVWVWVVYVLASLALAVGALLGGWAAFCGVLLEAALSFQFWTYATHRGLTRADR